MSFLTIKKETDAEETQRLALAPQGSKNNALSTLPITNPHPEIDQLIVLPSAASPSEETIIVGTVLEDRGSSNDNKYQRNHSFLLNVVASNHPGYQPGGHRIIVSESELRRACVLTPETLLSAFR